VEACFFEELREGAQPDYWDSETAEEARHPCRARKRVCPQAKTTHLRRVDLVDVSSYPLPVDASYYEGLRSVNEILRRRVSGIVANFESRILRLSNIWNLLFKSLYLQASGFQDAKFLAPSREGCQSENAKKLAPQSTASRNGFAGSDVRQFTACFLISVEGKSTGDWTKSTYEDLAADALATVQLLNEVRCARRTITIRMRITLRDVHRLTFKRILARALNNFVFNQIPTEGALPLSNLSRPNELKCVTTTAERSRSRHLRFVGFDFCISITKRAKSGPVVHMPRPPNRQCEWAQ